MIQASVADLQERLPYFLSAVKSGEKVVICEEDKPVAELVAVKKPVDVELRRSFFGMYEGQVDLAMLEEALRPMTDEEADDFIEGRY